jgi:hypothetical protein
MACSLAAERPLSKPITAVRHRQREPLFMPHTCHSRYPPGLAQMGGYLRLAPGVPPSDPIPQRTFKYVATVQSVTDETCQQRTMRAPALNGPPKIVYLHAPHP